MSKPAEFAIPERVHTACDELAANQINPTVKLVILRLGGGSPNDIAPLVRDWKAARAQKLVEQTSTAVVEIPESVKSAMHAVWRVAEAEIRSQGEAAKKAVEEAQAKHGEAVAELGRVKEDVKQRDETIEGLKTDIARLEGAAQTHKDELARAEERATKQLKEAEDRAAARLAEIQVRNEELQRQLIEAKGQAKDSDAQKARAEADAARLEKTLAATQKELAESRAEGAKLAQDLAGANAKLDAALATEKDLRTSLKREEGRCQGLDERIGELTKELARIARAKADEAEDGGGSSSSGRKDRK